MSDGMPGLAANPVISSPKLPLEEAIGDAFDATPQRSVRQITNSIAGLTLLSLPLLPPSQTSVHSSERLRVQRKERHLYHRGRLKRDRCESNNHTHTRSHTHAHTHTHDLGIGIWRPPEPTIPTNISHSLLNHQRPLFLSGNHHHHHHLNSHDVNPFSHRFSRFRSHISVFRNSERNPLSFGIPSTRPRVRPRWLYRKPLSHPKKRQVEKSILS